MSHAQHGFEPLEPRRLLAASILESLAGTSSSSPVSLTEFNGKLLYIADNGVHGRELWKSDGTPAGTVLVKDIRPGGASAFDGGATGEDGPAQDNAQARVRSSAARAREGRGDMKRPRATSMPVMAQRGTGGGNCARRNRASAIVRSSFHERERWSRIPWRFATLDGSDGRR